MDFEAKNKNVPPSQVGLRHIGPCKCKHAIMLNNTEATLVGDEDNERGQTKGDRAYISELQLRGR